MGSALKRRPDLLNLFHPSFRGSLPSLILAGPPGTGKTSLSKLLASQAERPLFELSAVSSGVKEVREVLDASEKHRGVYGIQSILFIDEIHRFSKSQQDSLLGAVESGDICLLAATTENPSISLNSALTSRCQVLQLEPLSMAELEAILEAALVSERGLAGLVTVEDEIRDRIIASGFGDARACLGILEAAALEQISSLLTHTPHPAADMLPVQLTESAVDRASKSVRRQFDKTGDAHYDVISAYIKSIRGSDADAAVFWLARMLDGGEDPRFIARRLVILASEDIGLADNQGLVLATSVATAANTLGMPEIRIPLAHVTIYLALAPKSNSAYLAINEAMRVVSSGGSISVPEHLQNLDSLDPQIRARVGKYIYPHDHKPPIVGQAYLPSAFANLHLYQPKDSGEETRMIEISTRIRKALGKRA